MANKDQWPFLYDLLNLPAVISIAEGQGASFSFNFLINLLEQLGKALFP